jgi:ABC-type Fe3+ transport system substrate-binding protein
MIKTATTICEGAPTSWADLWKPEFKGQPRFPTSQARWGSDFLSGDSAFSVCSKA